MPLFDRIKQYFPPSRKKEVEPALAYDQWSSGYDSQPGNLMLALDEQLFTELLAEVPVEDRMVADIGCGTGRHWAKLFEKKPARLIGFDVSAGMLAMLRQKYPQAETELLTDHYLRGLANESCDLVFSTLTVAHIEPIAEALREWRRVLKPGGHMLITDYHPDALVKGGQRTFSHNNRTVAVRNHIHPIAELQAIAGQLGLQTIRLMEKKIDDSVRPFYEQQQALALFERFKGVNIIYGLHLKAPGPGSA
jgi:ubiquinone/menaquinone biosynthesis C-methylase UbiE